MVTIADPSSRRVASIATSSAQVRASWPKVGSSRISTRGLVAIAAATVRRRFSPPESVYGFAAPRCASRRRVSSSSTRADTSSSGTPRARGPTASSSRTVLARSWCSGSWNTIPIRVRSSRDAHRIGDGSAPCASDGAAITAPPAGGRSPARVRPSVDLPAPFGPVIARASPARTSRSMSCATGRPFTRATASPCAESSTSPGAARGAGARPAGGRVPTRRPPPGAPLRAEHLRGRAVRDDPAGADHDDPREEGQPHLETMLHHHEGGGTRGEHPLHRIPHLAHALRVEVRRRLVQQHESGAHREHAGQGEALLLAARERRGRMVERHVEAHGRHRRLDARPDLRPRHPEVLAAEGDIVAGAGEDHLRVGILEDEPGPPAGRRGGAAVDEQLPSLSPPPRRRAHRRGRAAAWICPRQRPRAREPARRARRGTRHRAAPRRGDSRVATPTPGLDAGGSDLLGRHQTRTRASRPEPKRSRAPVAAMPRASTQDSAPAMTAPEITVLTR